MKNFTTLTAAAAVAGGLCVALLGSAAPATAAPTESGNAVQTIRELEAQGYKVIVKRLSQARLDEADVVSIGEGPTFTHTRSGVRNRDDYTGYDRQFAPDNVMTVYVGVR